MKSSPSVQRLLGKARAHFSAFQLPPAVSVVCLLQLISQQGKSQRGAGDQLTPAASKDSLNGFFKGRPVQRTVRPSVCSLQTAANFRFSLPAVQRAFLAGLGVNGGPVVGQQRPPPPTHCCDPAPEQRSQVRSEWAPPGGRGPGLHHANSIKGM